MTKLFNLNVFYFDDTINTQTTTSTANANAEQVYNIKTEKGVPIHYDLIGLNQNDPKLISAIRDKVLWPPSTSGKLNLKAKNKEESLKGSLCNICTKGPIIYLFL